MILLHGRSVQSKYYGSLCMRNLLAIAAILFVVGASSVLACDMNEADNMCKAGQVFDPQKGECRDATA